jgi:hypothetical protein
MRLLRSRRGDWIQIFLVIFFAFLVLVTIAMLTVENKKLQVDRPQLTEDLITQKMATTLISMLRTQTQIDCNGVTGKDSFASLIIINDGKCDESIRLAAAAMLGKDVPYVLKVEYPQRKITISNAQWLKDFADQQETAQGRVNGYIGRGYALLPAREGNIQVKLITLDKQAEGMVGFRHDPNEQYVLIASDAPERTLMERAGGAP